MYLDTYSHREWEMVLNKWLADWLSCWRALTSNSSFLFLEIRWASVQMVVGKLKLRLYFLSLERGHRTLSTVLKLCTSRYEEIISELISFRE